MRPPELGSIQSSLKNARIAWQYAESYWSDAVKERFQESYWEPLVEQIESSVRAAAELNEILAKAERDCRP